MSFAGRLWIGDGEERRRSERRPALAPSTLRTDERGPHDVRVLDVSRHGLRCTCPAPLAVGERVVVGLGGIGRADAVVRWSEAGLCGLEFVRPLGPAGLAAAFVGRTVLPWGGPRLAGRAAATLPASPARLFSLMLLLALASDLLVGHHP